MKLSFITAIVGFIVNTVSGHCPDDWYFILDQLAECLYIAAFIFMVNTMKGKLAAIFGAFLIAHFILSTGELIQEILRQNTEPQLADYVNWPCAVLAIFVFAKISLKRESPHRRHY